jgi:hypothetical protein
MHDFYMTVDSEGPTRLRQASTRRGSSTKQSKPVDLGDLSDFAERLERCWEAAKDVIAALLHDCPQWHDPSVAASRGNA